jgi:peptide-methionine (S)-S-oxide reductase
MPTGVSVMIGIGAWKQRLPQPGEALPGRPAPIVLRHERHHVLGTPLQGSFEGLAQVRFGMGCFWGAERRFWSLPGVFTTAAGYAGGQTPNPGYREVCSGQTGHAEVVLVVYDPEQLPFADLLKTFWEAHDPTQGMRQGNDIGSQYRSAIHCTSESQHQLALQSRDAFQAGLRHAGLGAITTEIVFPAPAFYYAEDEHQQYLSKNPGGYCGLRGTGVSCSIDSAA